MTTTPFASVAGVTLDVADRYILIRHRPDAALEPSYRRTSLVAIVNPREAQELAAALIAASTEALDPQRTT